MATVLYVEDEEDDIFFMRRAFNRSGTAHRLEAVADGQAAIDYLSGQGTFGNRQEHPLPQLVLLDLNLPMVSGFQVLKWIRAQPALHRLPVIIFSSSARVEDQVLAHELGASDYLQKPGSSLEFRELVETFTHKWLSGETQGRCCLPATPRVGSHLNI